MAQTIIIGTRGSKLALVQSEQTAANLRRAHPGLEVELRIISTVGDRVLDVALSAVGDKGLFVKEIEAALLAHEIDLAVHSCKDLPSVLPAGLTIGAFPARADARDALVLMASDAPLPAAAPLDALAYGARVGTSSLRRASQLRALRPDLALADIRGNVDTRLRKLAEGQFDGIVLAAAGLSRLGLTQHGGGAEQFELNGARFQLLPLPAELMLPAVAQGVLAIECRADDQSALALLAVLDDHASRVTTDAERAFLRRLEGGCQVPIAAFAEGGDTATLTLRGLVGSLDGGTIMRGERSGPAAEAEALGTLLAEELIAQGAGALLSAVR